MAKNKISIQMPDGEINDIDGIALENKPQEEILTWICYNIRDLEEGERLSIERDEFGYCAEIRQIHILKNLKGAKK